MKRLRIVFMGTPQFAVPTLARLADRHEVLLVVTQPDRPQGRGRKLTPSPVKLEALRHELPVMQPERIRNRQVREALTRLGADLFVVVAFGQILSPRLLAVPRLGCINVHGSILPKRRGPAPIQWTILEGERHAGVTIMKMDAGVDTGPILLQKQVDMLPTETSATLYEKLAPIGADLLIDALERLQAENLPEHPQDHSQATHAPLLHKEDGRVDFSKAASHVDAWIRGMDPWPGAFVDAGQTRLKLFRSTLGPGCGKPGEVLSVSDEGLLVACGQGAVWIGEIQPPGKRRMAAKAYIHGRSGKMVSLTEGL